MRINTTHQASPLDNALTIYAVDEPGHGGANHLYVVEETNDSLAGTLTVRFQKGPIGEHGVNGVSNDVLLAIVADRLEGFQSGPYACQDNGIALAKIQSAMQDLQTRTKERLARGVEGTSHV